MTEQTFSADDSIQNEPADEKMARVIDLLEHRPLHDTLREVFGTEYAHIDLLDELFTAGTENWRMLVSEHIHGDCLDLYSGYGKRSLLLAELSETVFAVDPDRAHLRFLSLRKDYESASRVVPVRGNVMSLPFDRSFDTIVATEEVFDRGASGTSFEDVVGELRQRLAADGSLILLVDGWSQQSGLANRLGIENGGQVQAPQSIRDIRRLFRSQPRGYRRTLESIGFDSVSLYALWPSRQLPRSVFQVDNPASDWILESFSNGSTVEGAVGRIANVFGRLGLLKYIYPSYLIVCSDGERSPIESDIPSPDADYDRLQVRGQSRSVALDYTDGTLHSVKKIPNRKRHAPYVRRETDVLEALRSADAPIGETLPSGTVDQSRFGPVYTERPATGIPLTDRISPSVESFRDTLEVGLGWLREFQETYRGEPITVSPEQIRADLSLERLGLFPPSISEPVTLFTVPCHGDFLPRNVFVENGAVSDVIDWEYGSLIGYPVTDLAFYAIRVATNVMGDLREGIETAFLERNPYSSALREVVRDYCSDVGLSVRAFLVYLAYPWIRRRKMDYERNAAVSYTLRSAGVAPYIKLLWDRMDTLERRFL